MNGECHLCVLSVVFSEETKFTCYTSARSDRLTWDVLGTHFCSAAKEGGEAIPGGLPAKPAHATDMV